MTNYNFTGKEISKKLDTNIIKNGGLQIVTLPIAKVSNDDKVDTIEFGGYLSLINYNIDREQQFKQDKTDKSMRKLKRNLRHKKLGQEGLTHNKLTQTYLAGGFKT